MTYETPDEAVPLARAYVYCGEWVADCPRPPDPVTRKGCGNVEYLYTPSRMRGPRDQRRPFFHCSSVGCGAQAPVDWPDSEHEIMEVLMARPRPETRNWYPKDHPVALAFRLEHGQSVRDLRAENERHGVPVPVRGQA